jgi:hypothetical protein
MLQLLHRLQILLIQIIKPDFVPHVYLLFVDQFAPVEGLRISQFFNLELVVYMLTDVPLVLFSFQIILGARNWYHYRQWLAEVANTSCAGDLVHLHQILDEHVIFHGHLRPLYHSW